MLCSMGSAERPLTPLRVVEVFLKRDAEGLVAGLVSGDQ